MAISPAPTASSSTPITTTSSCSGSSICGSAAWLGRLYDAGEFATSSTLDHGIGQPRFARDGASVMRPCGFYDLAAAAQDLVAELEDAQIRPGARPQPDDFLQHFTRRPIG